MNKKGEIVNDKNLKTELKLLQDKRYNWNVLKIKGRNQLKSN